MSYLCKYLISYSGFKLDIILRFQVGVKTRSEVKYLSVYGGPTTLQVRPLPHLRVLSLKRNMSAPTFTNFLRPPLLTRQFISLTQNIFLFEIITYSNLQITHSERSLGDILFIFNKVLTARSHISAK